MENDPPPTPFQFVHFPAGNSTLKKNVKVHFFPVKKIDFSKPVTPTPLKKKKKITDFDDNAQSAGA